MAQHGADRVRSGGQGIPRGMEHIELALAFDVQIQRTAVDNHGQRQCDARFTCAGCAHRQYKCGGLRVDGLRETIAAGEERRSVAVFAHAEDQRVERKRKRRHFRCDGTRAIFGCCRVGVIQRQELCGGSCTLQQIRAYEAADESMLNRAYKLMVNINRTHPFPIHRAKELELWKQGGYRDLMGPRALLT